MIKKILIFINYFGKPSETFISDEIKFLRNQSEIDLDILHYGKNISEENVYGLNLPSSFLKRIQGNPSKFSIENLKALKYRNGLNGTLGHLINFFKNKEYDTIYCHFGTNGKLIAELKELGVIPNKTKLVVRFHGLDMKFKTYPIGFYDILNKYSNNIIVGSKYAQKDILTYKINPDLVMKLPVGIKKVNISFQDSSVGKFNIVSIGRLVSFKGHILAIEIIRLFHKHTTNFQYTIVGKGPLKNELELLIGKYNLKDYVKIIPKLNHEKVLELVKNSHVYLYPGIVDKEGRAETQGLANLEAMAKGVIILASDVGGVTDYVIDGKTGFLCESGNVESFVNKLQWTIENYHTDQMTQIRKSAIDMVKSHYCQEELNKKLLELLMN